MNVFHIGFPKSASTTLQKQLFDKHSQLNFLGVYPTKNIGNDTTEVNSASHYLTSNALRKFHELLTNIEGIEFNYSSYNQEMKEVNMLLSRSKINVFSNERFSSVLFAHKDRAEKARRIKKFFPNSKIIIIIRNQIDIIKSQYRDHPFDPRNLYSNKKSVNIEQWIERDMTSFDIGFINSIDYIKIIEFYSELFGVANVGVFLFEELVHDTKLFSRNISNFLGISEDETYELLNKKHENDGVSQSLNKYRKTRQIVINALPINIKNNKFVRVLDRVMFSIFKKGKKQKVEISNESLEKLNLYFAPGNKKLAQKLNLNIEKYGYPL